MQERKGPHRCGGDIGSPRLFWSLGCWRLRLDSKSQDWQTSPANCAARVAAGRAWREEHRGRNSTKTKEAVCVHHAWPARDHWPPHRCRQHPGHSVIRLFCVVLVADNLPRQTAALRNEAARGIRLDFGTVFPEGLHATYDV